MLFVTPFKTNVTGVEGNGAGVGAGVGLVGGGSTASPDFLQAVKLMKISKSKEPIRVAITVIYVTRIPKILCQHLLKGN